MATASNIVTPLNDVTAFLGTEHGLFIDGSWREARSSDRIDVYNPATGERIASVVNANAQDVDDAVRSIDLDSDLDTPPIGPVSSRGMRASASLTSQMVFTYDYLEKPTGEEKGVFALDGTPWSDQ